ncbi:MAG: hypothetical protein LBR47_02310 [Spirochaetaceae bacterium]|jgi:hypothetical protein|nr:hypothetical protein [Spirochaetaceae bacterium]
MARKKPNEGTIKRLYALSGNRCAFPNCDVKFADRENDTNLSEICHIEAAEQGGVRYNSHSNDTDRKSFGNLILLCPNHHTEVDNPSNASKYTVEVLRKMKKAHEVKMLKPELIQKNPAILNDIIKLIGEKLFGEQTNETQNAPNSQEKIKFNNVIRYKYIIEEYSAYQGKLNKIYEEIEKQGSNKKVFLLQNITNLYLEEKSLYSNFEEIKRNADNIIDNIKEKLWTLIDINLDKEAVEVGLLVILVDAFMRCNILEEPPKL